MHGYRSCSLRSLCPRLRTKKSDMMKNSSQQPSLLFKPFKFEIELRRNEKNRERFRKFVLSLLNDKIHEKIKGMNTFIKKPKCQTLWRIDYFLSIRAHPLELFCVKTHHRFQRKKNLHKSRIRFPTRLCIPSRHFFFNVLALCVRVLSKS